MSSHETHEKQPTQSTSSPDPGPPVEQARPEGEPNPVSPQENLSEFAWPELSKTWRIPRLKRHYYEQRQKHFTDQERKDAWDAVTSVVKEHSDEIIERWTEEMDTLLVYAGLFSAVLTAFNAQSYALLTPSGPDPVLDALQRISEQLSSFSINPTFVNSTAPAWQQSANSAQALPQRWVVWLNALWFSSLICSLSSASVAIMVKQWLNEYKTGIFGNSRHTARLRQYRLDGLARWRVGTIISILPVLLQISLGLFLAGLLVLLWNLNFQVALAASTLVGVLLLFTAVTSLLPIVRSDCSYQTPISLALFYLSLPIRSLPSQIHRTFERIDANDRVNYRVTETARWFMHRLDNTQALFSLRAMEKSRVQDQSEALDANAFVKAYTATMDLSHLNHASVCFTDLEPEEISRVFDNIDAENVQHGCRDIERHWTLYIPSGMAFEVFLAKCICGRPQEELSLLKPYLDASEVVDAVGSSQWNHVMSSCATTLHSYASCADPTFWRNLSRCLSCGISQLNTEQQDYRIPEAMLHSTAASAYKTLRECWKSRYTEWFSDYTSCLYALITCTRTVATQGKNEDKDFPHTLHDAIAAAQSNIVEFFKTQQKSDAPEHDVLSAMFYSNLESVEGISDAMLDAMNDYANSSNPKIHEYEADRIWVRDLKRKRDEARMKRASTQSQAVPSSALIPATECFQTPATDLRLALTYPPQSGAVVTISSSPHWNVPPEENVASIVQPRDLSLPVSHGDLVPTLSLGQTVTSQTTPHAMLNATEVPTVDACTPAMATTETSREAEESPSEVT